jgi:hypothetical protein
MYSRVESFSQTISETLLSLVRGVIFPERRSSRFHAELDSCVSKEYWEEEKTATFYLVSTILHSFKKITK